MGWLMPNWRGLFHIQMKLIIGTWDELREPAMLVRRDVFIQEQGVPEEMEWDYLDRIATHVVVIDGDRAVATGRLIQEQHFKIGRMAVLATHRLQGLGSRMLKALIEAAKQRGANQIQLHAQVSAIPFYAKHDFEPTGPIFDEVGIDHVLMTLEL